MPESVSCDVREWSTPKLLNQAPEGVVLRASTLLPREDGGFVLLGHDLYSFLDEPLTSSRLRVLDSNGTVSPGPLRSEASAFHVAPTAVRAAGGGLHVVWGESERNAYPLERRRFPLLHVDQLWYAYRSPDGSWSDARLVLASPDPLDWGSYSQPLAVDRNGTLHLVVGTLRGGPGTLHYLRWFPGSGTIFRNALQVWPIGRDATVTAGDDVVVAFIGSPPAASNPQSSQVFVASVRSGEWGEPRPVGPPSPGYANRPRLVSANDALHLVWRQGDAPGRSSGLLAHTLVMTTPDGPVPISVTNYARLPGTVDDFSAIGDGCGTVHVSWIGNAADPTLQVVSIDSTPPPSAINPFPHLNVIAIAIATDEEGVPQLVFAARDATIAPTARDPPYRLFYSRFDASTLEIP